MTDKTSSDQPAKETGWPLTTDDLYGPSKATDVPLVYEETPIIDPIVDEPANTENELLDKRGSRQNMPEEPQPVPETYAMPVQHTDSKPAFKKSIGDNNSLKVLVNVFLIILLFGLGFGTSILLKSTLSEFALPEIRFPSFTLPTFSGSSPEISSNSPSPTVPVYQESPQDLSAVTPTPEPIAKSSPTAVSGWKTLKLLGGISKQPVAGIAYNLPADSKDPVCNQTSCASQGTDLPGGTRFTVAPRGQGYALPDPSGYVLTDTSGRKFKMTETTIAGFPATEYRADFAGSTLGGYGFTKMRGAMVKVNDSLTVELNHFSPTNSNSDFAADDRLFDQILTSLTYSSAEDSGVSR